MMLRMRLDMVFVWAGGSYERLWEIHIEDQTIGLIQADRLKAKVTGGT